MKRARASVGAATFSAAFAAGQVLTLEQATAAAAAVATLVDAHSKPAKPSSPTVAARLSRREREVLCLIATGRANAEIADELYVSTRTATTHVSNILAKLGMNTRTEAAAFAVRHGLC